MCGSLSDNCILYREKETVKSSLMTCHKLHRRFISLFLLFSERAIWLRVMYIFFPLLEVRLEGRVCELKKRKFLCVFWNAVAPGGLKELSWGIREGNKGGTHFPFPLFSPNDKDNTTA